MKAASIEAARVWQYCVERHREVRWEHLPWPGRKELQEETKGGQFALHSQSIQMITHRFLANVDAIRELRKTDKRHRYPYRPKTYLAVEWPAQAVSRKGNTLLLPMGRGRKSLTFHLQGLPDTIGAVSLVWNGGYELHIMMSQATTPLAFVETSADRVATATLPLPATPSVRPVQACVDLGEIHLAAVTTSTGKGRIVTGRQIRALKRQQAMTQGEIQRKRSCCQKGSRRYRKLCYALERTSGQAKRQVRDLRHKATRQVVAFCAQEGVEAVYVGNPHGVRNKDSGRHHNQRMARWEYGKDLNFLQYKCRQAQMTCFTGSERGTSSTCPSCGKRKKPKGRIFACRHCGFVGHRDLVGSLNMHPLAFGSRVNYPSALTYRRPGPARVCGQRRDEQPLLVLPHVRTRTS